MNFQQYSMTQSAITAINEAINFVSSIGESEVGTEHLLYGLAKGDSSASNALAKYGVTADKVLQFINKPHSYTVTNTKIDFSPRVKYVFQLASTIATQQGMSMAGSEHLLIALLRLEGSIAHYILEKMGIDKEDILDELIPQAPPTTTFSISFGPEGFNLGEGGNQYAMKKAKKSSAAGTKLPDSLREMGVDLTERARQKNADPIIGRDKEIERLIQILCRKTKNNPVLIGEPGVGKTAVVEGLAQAIVKGDVPELLKDKIIYALDIGSMLAGTKYRGDMEQKLKDTIETVASRGDIIIFIDELHTLATAGADKGEVKPSDMLKPYLARGELQTIGATTTEEYRKFIEKDKALERRFQPILVEPPTEEDAIKILKGLRDNYEAYHKVAITDEAIEAAVKLSERYIMDRYLPDKAIDLIDEAASRVKVSGNTYPSSIKEKEEELQRLEAEKMEAVSKNELEKAIPLRDRINALKEELKQLSENWKKERTQEKPKIDVEDIAQIVSSWTKIPVTKINETEKEKLVKLEEILKKRVIGQDEAASAVAKAIRRARAGLKNPNKPIGSFIFLGPTGTGKTELSKALCEAMFDDENLMIRLDMSEYMESHSVSKLIGSPPGYVGYDEGGQLTEQVRRKPYSVILFDEIEKAHPDVYNMLLQILDDGRLTDAQGRVVSFKNTIIIMTSNVGVSALKEKKSLGFSENTAELDAQKTKEALTEALKKRFKPEFLNRVDVITIFNSLTKDNIKAIAIKMLGEVNKKLKDKNINISFTDRVVDWLADNGYDNEYGARPLRRLIEQKIEDSLAEELLSGKVNDNTNIICDYKDDKIIFLPAK